MVKVCEVSARPGCARRTRDRADAQRARSPTMHGRFALAARWPVARGVGEEAHGKMATGKRRTINEPRLSKGTSRFEGTIDYMFSMAMSTATLQLRAAAADLNPKHPTCAARLTRRDLQRTQLSSRAFSRTSSQTWPSRALSWCRCASSRSWRSPVRACCRPRRCRTPAPATRTRAKTRASRRTISPKRRPSKGALLSRRWPCTLLRFAASKQWMRGRALLSLQAVVTE